MKKGVETATTTKVVAAAAAAAAAASFAENVDLWAQQDWIKNILSKSGTEIKEVPAEDLCKMVYYSGLPLLMTQQQQQQQQQLQHGPDGTILQLNYNDANSAEQYAVPGQSARNGTMNGYQPQPQHHTISLTNGLTISNGPQSCNSNSSSSSSNGSGQLTIMLNPPVSGQSMNHQPSVLPGTYGAPISPLEEKRTSSSPEQSAYPAQMSSAPASSKFRCDQCNISFGSKSAHTSHMKSHAKQQQASEKMPVAKLAESAIAAAGTTGTGSLGTQQPDPYQCDVCKKTFAVPARLVRHYRTHTGERPFECEFCHKMFSVKENLQVHRRIHTKERPYKCEICGRAFEHSGKLHRHMRIHTGERPHKCNVCGKTFIQSGQLVIHMRTHTGEKPYKCPVEGCGKGFTCSKQLKVHSRTHTGEKPYHCDICFRDFGYNHVLKLHRVQHYGAKCYKCTICDETFKSKKEMEAHIKGHANELPDDEEGAEGGCKQEDPAGGTERSAASTAVEIPSGGNSNSNSNSSFEYSSSMSHTEGTEHAPSSDEPSGQSSGASRFTILKSSSPSPPSTASSCVGINDDGQLASVDEEDDEEDDADEDEMDHKQVPPYDTMAQSFDQSLQRAYGSMPTGGVAPALLAAASIAAAVENGCTEVKFCPDIKPQRSISPVQPAALSITRVTPPPSSGSSSSSSSSSSVLSIPPAAAASSTLLEPTGTGVMAASGQFMYEPLAIMKHHGYFAPASQITEYRSSSDIVRQVEAAIAGTENLLTPPRSSPESPDRSSSPESDSVLMADRDNNTLPPRKRKLYFKDSQQQSSGPKMASVDTVTSQHYGVVQQSIGLQQQQQQTLPRDVHSGHHQQHFHHHQIPPQQHGSESHHQQPSQQAHYSHQPSADEERSVKLEVLRNVSPCHREQRQPSPTPTQPQVATTVIRMSSVIQYANKSS
ncbi:Krueppel homolog 1-like [Anopheles marshallii]|uniref:Krueppel homolog 1-like n=1 Tax=Anopheles marshallii TaxID=1521116 RepID=UPI00237AEC04|nr:Krueppel homolog 1-like [Anopheles marshallii]